MPRVGPPPLQQQLHLSPVRPMHAFINTWAATSSCSRPRYRRAQAATKSVDREIKSQKVERQISEGWPIRARFETLAIRKRRAETHGGNNSVGVTEFSVIRQLYGKFACNNRKIPARRFPFDSLLSVTSAEF